MNLWMVLPISREVMLHRQIHRVQQSLEDQFIHLDILKEQYQKEPSPRILDKINRVFEQMELKLSEGYRPIREQLKKHPSAFLERHMTEDLALIARIRDDMSRFSERRR